jgi:hypothetical protein
MESIPEVTFAAVSARRRINHIYRSLDGLQDVLVVAATAIDQESLPCHEVTVGRRQEECGTG